MWGLSIRTRLILLFTLQAVLILGIGGFYLDWRLRQALEEELSHKLQNLAGAAALQVDGELLANLATGDEQSRTYRNLRTQLLAFQQSTHVRRVYIFSPEKKSYIDTRENMRIGVGYVFLAITDAELRNVLSGATVASPLFEGEDGSLYKTGFAPVRANAETVAAVAVEGSATTLEAVQTVRGYIVLLGLFVLLGSIALGAFFAERITTPINRLKSAAGKIAEGDYETGLDLSAGDEIGFLAQTMEEMRHAIVNRDLRQKAMVAGVAHEIRNPLGGIELFAGLLADEVSDPDTKKQAEKIKQEVRNLNRIVTDFLDYARPQKSQKRPTPILPVFEEVTQLMAQELEKHEISTQETHAETTALVDPDHLKQILLNLVRNSVQAMPTSGGLTLTVESYEKSARVTLADSGTGIPAEIRERIFDPFCTARQTGTGLGLAIVKSLVEENGGQVSLLESGDKGTHFELIFPA